MQNTLKKSLAQEVLGYWGAEIFQIVSYICVKLWRFVKYYVFRFKDRRIVYGKIGDRKIFDFPINRNQHTAIKGKTGFGKSGLAANLAIQNINQGTRTLFIDPHGNPYASDKEKGASVEVYTRARSVRNVVFLSVNQKQKVIGYNPLFLLGKLDELDNLKDELMNSIFYDSTESMTKGHEVAGSANFLLESAVYFHSAYFNWLILEKGKNSSQAKDIIRNCQITINDLVSLETNPLLIDLFIHILGYKASIYYRPDLVAHWKQVKERTAFDKGLKGAIGRLKKIVSTTKSAFFFESYGFNLLEEMKKNRSVLCDLSKLDKFTTAIITKLILVKVYILHENGILRGQTEFYTDEAANIEMSNTAEILTQGRKFKLALTLIYQFDKQFKNPDTINAIKNTVVTKINFRNQESDFNAPIEKVANLKERHFIIEKSKGVFENVRTVDMPAIKRKLELVERGAGREELRARMMTKRTDILKFFLNI